jgi:glycerate 2-kinase
MSDDRLRSDGWRILKKALGAADAGNAVRSAVLLPFDCRRHDRTFLLGAGKAAVPMALALEEKAGQAITGEIVVTKHGHAEARLQYGEVIEAGHPIPDENGEKAARQIRDRISNLNARDLVIVAISGGASALLPAPAGAVTLRAKQETTDLLLKAGADIHQLNAVRKHLSFLKGGRMAKLAYPATVVSLLLSDVIGDPLDVIGSGPTAPDETTFADAINVLEEFGLLAQVPRCVRAHLQDGLSGLIEETPKPGDPIFGNVHNVVLGSNRLALEAAASEAKRLGYEATIFSSSIAGETRTAAFKHAEMLRELARKSRHSGRPICILSGGETTVAVRGAGKGGRNQEFALAAAIGIAGLENVALFSAGTDGTDGPTDAAGAIATGTTVARAQRLGMSVEDHLARNDSYPFFDALGDLIRTGPTGTNVMDIQIMLAA